MTAQRTYLAIDLKSFYASVECVDRHLDPLTTNLVDVYKRQGLFHCKCGTSWKRDIGFLERTPDMVFSLERKKVGNKIKPLPAIQHK